MAHTTEGTKEWAYKNLNICKGCQYNCSYCYAKRMAKRFKRINEEKEWLKIQLNKAKIGKGYRKLDNPTEKYDYMFPTSHDIFPEILNECIIVLSKILRARNSVLITTKPNLQCIRKLVKELYIFKDQICFRFTITTRSDKAQWKYEPNAPSITQRIQALRLAYECEYKTSISIEPFLDKNPIPLILELQEYVSDTIWLGIMSGPVPKELKPNYSKENLQKISHDCLNLPQKIRTKIRLKDSIVHKLALKKKSIEGST